jgi:Family of unknown function (DUF6152)
MTGFLLATRSRRRLGAGIKGGAIACAAAFTLSTSLPAAAHHSFSAEFDSAREVKATGEVSKLEWMNPHGWIHVGVQELCERPGRQGRGDDEPQAEWNCRAISADEAEDWAFELASPNGLMRQGWTRNSLGTGDRVTIEGTRARDDSFHANARVVTTADGKRLFAGSSERSTP